jgi:thioredoxin
MAKEVIKFFANWCGPCKIYAPKFEKVKQELSEEVTFTEVNVEEDPKGLCAEYKVRGIPCTVVLEDGVEISRETGMLTEEILKDLILKN